MISLFFICERQVVKPGHGLNMIISPVLFMCVYVFGIALSVNTASKSGVQHNAVFTLVWDHSMGIDFKKDAKII